MDEMKGDTNAAKNDQAAFAHPCSVIFQYIFPGRSLSQYLPVITHPKGYDI